MRKHSLIPIILLSIATAVAFNNCASPTESQNESASVLGTEFSGTITGGLIVIESSGLVQGYAYDPVNPTKFMRVYFVIDGAESAGTYAGSVIAGKNDPGAFTGHYFSFTMPAAFRNGVSHSLYVYGHEVNLKNRLSGSPKSFVAFSPKSQSVYTGSGLSGFITNSCNRCHNWTYLSLFYSTLVIPNPFSGGSSTNNKLINKISGSHGGNNPFCASKSTFPCSAIQDWWNAEF
jgi:hypothetical protein